MTKHLLSKSTFMNGVQCPLRLYLHKFKPELRNPVDEEQQAIFDTGTKVGVLAQGVFPGGVDVTPPDSYSYPIAAAKTQEAIKQGAKIIYEATFYYDDIMCAVDILVNKNGKWYAHEVKSVNSVKPPHKMDASLQYYVLKNAGIKVEDFFIMHFNKEYIKRGEIEVDKLFTSTSVLEDVLENQEFIQTKSNELKKILLSKKEPTIEPGDHCSKPYECDFMNHCWKNVVQEKKDYGKKAVDKKAIKEFIDTLEYPLYYFDFETVNYAVPVYDESRPYQAVPFQYSLHIQKSKNSELEHLYFLGDGINDPREALINELIAHVNDKGTILVWYKPFESGKLKDLARDYPKYEKKINLILGRIIDLMDPFKKDHYYDPGFEGSASIKKVMPVLIPELSYGDLEIQEGMAASMAYANIKDQPTNEQIKIRQALLDYCHLDTLAMVKIFEKLLSI